MWESVLSHGIWMHQRSLHHISRWYWAMQDTDEARKYKDIGGSARNRILALVRRIHPLIIGTSMSNQESREQPCIPRRVYGDLVILAHLDPSYVRGYLRNQKKRGSTPETKFSTLLFWFYIENRARWTKIRHLSLIVATSIAQVHIAKTMPQNSCRIK